MVSETDYLDNTSEGGVASTLLGAATSLYGYSTIDMMAQFRKTGRLYAPWTGALTGGEKLGINMAGKKWGGLKYSGSSFKGANNTGRMLMGLSRVASVANTSMLATDPIWFATRFMNNPLALAAGAAWFAGGAVIQGASRGLERGQYTKMATPFEDSEQSYTSRQRAVRAISESHLQARSAIGNEAQLYHR